ncbi:hypothetical protein JB92DRAFT_3093533, partial [Gautieria morchelliformis]
MGRLFFGLLAALELASVGIVTGTLVIRAAHVNLRIEGAVHTIFEASSSPAVMATQSGEMHHYDGTNNLRNPTPGPTATSALDNAADLAHFTWDAYVNIHSILLRWKQQVREADQVLWAFDAFSKTHFLPLPYNWAPITVTDGSRGQPIEDAIVNGHLTNAPGQATLAFTDGAFPTCQSLSNVRSFFPSHSISRMILEKFGVVRELPWLGLWSIEHIQ